MFKRMFHGASYCSKNISGHELGMKRDDANMALLQLALKASWRKTWNRGHCHALYIGCACRILGPQYKDCDKVWQSTVCLCMICETVACSPFFALLTSNVLHGFTTTKQNEAGWLEARKVEGSWTCLGHIAPCFEVRMQHSLLCTRQLNQSWLGVLPKMRVL